MSRYSVLLLLFVASTMTSWMRGMLPIEEKKGFVQMVKELPRELQNMIIFYVLEMRENQQYEVYKKIYVGSRVSVIALNGDNTRALTGSEDGRACLWDVEKGRVLTEIIDRGRITSVALSANGSIALIGSWSGRARIWNTGTGELIEIVFGEFPVYSGALSSDGKTALIGCCDERAYLYNTATGKLLKKLKGHTGSLISVTLSLDGKKALTGSSDGTALVWNTLTGKVLQTFLVGSVVRYVTLSADAKIALTGPSAGKALLWDVKTGALLNTFLTTTIDPIMLGVVSKDGERVFTSTAVDNTIEVWNAKPLSGKNSTRDSLGVFKAHTKPIVALTFGGADFIATGSRDKTVIIWKPFTLKDHYWPLEQGKLDWGAFTEQEKIVWQAFKEIFYKPDSSSSSIDFFKRFIKLIIFS